MISWAAHSFDQLDTHGLYQILHLRQQIFVVEQNCVYEDLDNLDQRSLHLLATEEGQLLAYLRALPPGLSYSRSAMGRIAVAPAARGRQLGRELVMRGIELNRQHWPDSGIQIGAQAHLEDFYRSCGFETSGEAYIEDGIPHVHMIYREEKK